MKDEHSRMISIKTINHHYDVLILGAGGSGLAAAIFAANKKLDVAVVSKVNPLNSHTVAAQGGINASLGNVSRDDWMWHAYDTIKASDWLADQDSVEEMCKEAPNMIHMLDQLGVEFDKNPDGKISQKIYGGQSADFGKGGFAHRACYSKDKTGHSIMYKLFEEAQNKKVIFYNYYFALDLLIENNICYGLLCLDIENGVLNIIYAKNIIIATGGYSQIYSTATSSAVCTGDGNGLAARAGISLQDMEFVQFHPTALHKVGILITEAARSAGGRLLNSKNERFMEKYAPKFLELAARDVVSRAIATEINEGRGCGEDKDYVVLDLTHLTSQEIKKNLPTIFENCNKFANLDPSMKPIPIAPAAHYTMGGIPTNSNCQVIRYNGNEVPIDGLYAIGEAACISVHGAARLGCNSLLDLLVFAQKAVNSLENTKRKKISQYNWQKQINDFRKIFDREKADINKMTDQLKNLMSRYLGVFRSKRDLELALEKVNLLQKEYDKASIADKSLQWNVELQHYLELGNMLVSAIASIKSALWREESRGSHWRYDFQEKNDIFLAHSISSIDLNISVMQRPVRKSLNNVRFYQPSDRIY